MNFRYPIFLDLTGKKCVVIGDHPELAPKLQALAEAGARVEWKHADFDFNDLCGSFLVIASLPDNSEVFRFCEQHHILCNAVDDAENCRFIFGAVHRQGDLTIAISTNGCAPALAVRLREQFEREFGPEYAELLAILKEVRPQIASRLPDAATRRYVWYRILDLDVLEKFRAGQREAAIKAVRTVVEEAVSNISRCDTSAESADR